LIEQRKIPFVFVFVFHNSEPKFRPFFPPAFLTRTRTPHGRHFTHNQRSLKEWQDCRNRSVFDFVDHLHSTLIPRSQVTPRRLRTSVGILASDSGLGKTLVGLTLILACPAPKLEADNSKLAVRVQSNLAYREFEGRSSAQLFQPADGFGNSIVQNEPVDPTSLSIWS
jgi:hypothetical protein